MNYIYVLNTVDEVVSKFKSLLYRLLDYCIPRKIRKPTCSRTYPVYYTKAIIGDIAPKARLHSVWKQTGNSDTYEQFKILRSKIKHNIKAAHVCNINNVFRNLTTNPSLFWQFVNTLRCRGGIEPAVTRGDSEYRRAVAATAFATHFKSLFLPN